VRRNGGIDVPEGSVPGSDDDPVVDPPYLHAAYRSTILRAPAQALATLPRSLTETTGPLLGEGRVGELDHDLTRQHADEPQGQRIIVHGRVLEGDGRPVRNTLVEVWQANAGGRYAHPQDSHAAPLDPNFTGAGRALTDDEGRYRFVTIKPGAYPWKNHANAWRPAHIHFSLLGPTWAARLVTQMYFADDPLLALDPIFNAIPTEPARQRLIAAYAHEITQPEWALGWRWDIVLGGSVATPFEPERTAQP
jgi:protocatechuate 3,4-dioxygenase beta subunit